MSLLAGLIAQRSAHPARTVVLLPYAQLMPLARRAWARARPDGFAPRFETTMNWTAAQGRVPGAEDLSFDMGRDLLTARALLERAGLAGRAELLAARLVEQAWQLADPAQAQPPAQRAAWAANARAAIALDAPVLALESAVARIALEWAAASSYAGDLLLESAAQGVDLLVVVAGLQPEPRAAALAAMLGERAHVLPLAAAGEPGAVQLHACAGPADEAERAAACVLRHLQAGRVPVALAATDRVLTRRIRALLEGAGLAIRDETGWKLSTTRSAAHVMGLLRACAWDAPSDEVLDFLKNAPALAAWQVLALERRVRRLGLREWAQVEAAATALAAVAEPIGRMTQWRESLRGARPLAQWLAQLREVLQDCGHWQPLALDAAGAKVLEALGLHEESGAALGELPQAARRLRLPEFAAWASDVLEAASFVPAHPEREHVVILPFGQVLGRGFPALVLPGCDEVRLPASPEPPGPWTARQRELLGLPSRQALEAAQREGWRQALRTPHCDVLWRAGDDGGEPLLPSALVLELSLQGAAVQAPDPRAQRELQPAPVARPQAPGAQLPLPQISASAYEDLRRCPYRFFALRQLGLQEADEIDAELDKRDFGNWLHAVLRRFHESLQREPVEAGAQRAQRLEEAAQQTTREQGLDEAEFLPFAAAWPAVREGYLQWLDQHEAQGLRFEAAETAHEMPLGPLKLVGRIDRIDRAADGTALVVDYKTEPLAATRDRIKRPTEDTQLAFYAALLADDTLRAAYVNVGERDGTKLVEQEEVVAARDALVEGMLHDLRRVAEGAAMPALGEGAVCDFCAARGLCRRDFWNE